MTPRIAFAIVCSVVFSLPCARAGAQEITTNSDSQPGSTPQPLATAAQNEAAATAVPAGSDGPLPVIEVDAPAPLPETIDLTYESAEIFQHLLLSGVPTLRVH